MAFCGYFSTTLMHICMAFSCYMLGRDAEAHSSNVVKLTFKDSSGVSPGSLNISDTHITSKDSIDFLNNIIAKSIVDFIVKANTNCSYSDSLLREIHICISHATNTPFIDYDQSKSFWYAQKIANECKAVKAASRTQSKQWLATRKNTSIVAVLTFIVLVILTSYNPWTAAVQDMNEALALWKQDCQEVKKSSECLAYEKHKEGMTVVNYLYYGWNGDPCDPVSEENLQATQNKSDVCNQHLQKVRSWPRYHVAMNCIPIMFQAIQDTIDLYLSHFAQIILIAVVLFGIIAYKLGMKVAIHYVTAFYDIVKPCVALFIKNAVLKFFGIRFDF
jgi:hypothetical protein